MKPKTLTAPATTPKSQAPVPPKATLSEPRASTQTTAPNSFPRQENRLADWGLDVEPAEAEVNGRVLLDDLADVLARFVVLPKWGAETLALWVLHTYAFELRDVCAYLGIESPEKRCGKTTLLTVLGELVNRPVIAANISSSAFFRVIEELRPTLLIDEADTLLRGNDELRGILNAGYGRKTAFVVRMGGQPAECQNAAPARRGRGLQGASRLSRFSCWCPKAIAAIGRLPETLADRCLLIRMQRKSEHESCERLRNLACLDLRRRCARFVQDTRAGIATAQPQLPATLHDRALDIWEPLFVLADLAGGGWPERARQAASGLAAQAPEASPIGSLLMDLYIAFGLEGSGRMFSRELVSALNRSSDRPWLELTGGKPADDNWLARQLRPYGVKPRTLRIGDDRGKGYLKEDLLEVFRRYIPSSELDAALIEQQQIVASFAPGPRPPEPASPRPPTPNT